ncbi:uncharacterized protein [Onthophagus taurus]|uniref:uncharacterized protein n=1 Tax=Onthophagus taurus TaxID=166361 RepID=UPI0039BECF62
MSHGDDGVNGWQKIVENISLSDIHDKRRVHVLLVVEKTASDLEKLLMIKYHSESDGKGTLKFISMNDLYDFIISYEIKNLHVDEFVMKIIRTACNDARKYLQRGKDLPIDLLGRIIKLKVLTVVTCDIYERHQEIVNSPNYLHKLMFITHLDEAEQKRRKDQLRDPFRELYILLIQFYNPKIISSCCKGGVPIDGIIEFGDKNKTFSDYPLERRNSDIFREEFWKKVPKFYQHHGRILEPFLLFYPPITFKIFKRDPHIYANQCSKLYDDFARSIDVENIHNMRKKFLQNLDIKTLLKAEVVQNYDTDDESDYETPTSLNFPIFNDPSLIPLNTMAPTSTTIDWVRNFRPRIKRVDNELDIDGRMRFSKWSTSHC